MKTCSKCSQSLSLNQFSIDRHRKDGHQSKCRSCVKIYNRMHYRQNIVQRKAWQKQYDQVHTEQKKAQMIKYYLQNPGRRAAYQQKYYQSNIEFLKAWMKKYAQKHAKALKIYRREWRKRNAPLVVAYTRKHQAALLQRTPNWLTPEQEQQVIEFYINCPKGMEVDHIIPLQGKCISGLHHPDNLQYLTRHENRAKGNRCSEIVADFEVEKSEVKPV
ncbi:hypothetical protein LCGC14_2301550 [marine sediment metagenome]|uniref:HNH nuclease domain-containing protein n=1 Tax=marine sediment metagenome TaxID=412755 RepID=A0A0F9FIB2_9ZZZZ